MLQRDRYNTLAGGALLVTMAASITGAFLLHVVVGCGVVTAWGIFWACCWFDAADKPSGKEEPPQND